MKKVICILLLALVATMNYSCTPQSLIDAPPNPQSCCGDDYNGPPVSGNTKSNG